MNTCHDMTCKKMMRGKRWRDRLRDLDDLLFVVYILHSYLRPCASCLPTPFLFLAHNSCCCCCFDCLLSLYGWLYFSLLFTVFLCCACLYVLIVIRTESNTENQKRFRKETRREEKLKNGGCVFMYV